MKKTVILMNCVLACLLLVSCDFNAPLRNKMINYYSQDSNYSDLTGVIRSIKPVKGTDELFLEIDLLSENPDFSCNLETGYYEFVLVNRSAKDYDLKVNDTIVFTSAPMYFYNGHILPIIRIERNDSELLSFDAGKESYLNWIKSTFD
jgi:hypothetical protein